MKHLSISVTSAYILYVSYCLLMLQFEIYRRGFQSGYCEKTILLSAQAKNRQVKTLLKADDKMFAI